VTIYYYDTLTSIYLSRFVFCFFGKEEPEEAHHTSGKQECRNESVECITVAGTNERTNEPRLLARKAGSSLLDNRSFFSAVHFFVRTLAK
jgi:hypothetical protein